MQRLLHNNYNCEQATYTFDGRLILEYLKQNKETDAAIPDLIFLRLGHASTNRLGVFGRIGVIQPYV